MTAMILAQRPGIKIEYIPQADGGFIIHTVQDVAPILENNKRLQNQDDGYSKSREFARVASIPISVQYEWIQKYGFDPLMDEDDTVLKRLLNSNEYRYLKTSEIML